MKRFMAWNDDVLRAAWAKIQRGENFHGPEQPATISRMEKRKATITKEQLAELAGRYFLSADIDDVPAKLWIDTSNALEQSYLRACFEGEADAVSVVRLSALADALNERHGTNLVCVVYPTDHEWEEIEAWSVQLQQAARR